MEIGNHAISTVNVSTSSLKPSEKLVEQDKLSSQKPLDSVDSPIRTLDSVPEEDLNRLLNKVNESLDLSGQGIMFSVDKSTNSSVLKVVDKTTDEVIKQFPSEGSLKIMQNIQSYLSSVNNVGVLSKEGLTGSLLNEII